jgi:hypothetical protein
VPVRPARRGARPGARGRTSRHLGARGDLGKARAGAGAEAGGGPRRGATSAGRSCVSVSLFEHIKLQKVE